MRFIGVLKGRHLRLLIQQEVNHMPQSLADIPLHIVFSTKNRHPWILPKIEKELFQYICGNANRLKSPVIKINGVEDHIHILMHLGRTI